MVRLDDRIWVCRFGFGWLKFKYFVYMFWKSQGSASQKKKKKCQGFRFDKSTKNF